MSEESNKQTIQEMYAAFGRGDVDTILGKLSDDVLWVVNLDTVVPWSGDYSGKGNVPRFFDAIFQSVQVESFEPQDWYTDGDTVVSTGEFGCLVNSTGKTARMRWIFVWKFNGDRVVSYEQFGDTALADAFRA